MTLTLGKYTSFNTIIHRLDSRIKLIGLIVLLVVTFLSYGNGYMNITINFGILILVITLSIVSKTSFIRLFKSLKALWMMVVLLLLLNIFLPTSTGGDIAFTIGSIDVYYKTIVNVSFILLRLIIVLAETNIFTSTTKPMDMTYALEWLFYPLKFLHFPVHQFAMAISLALRFIPTLSEDAQRIMKSQASRGVDYKQGRFKEKVKAVVSLIIPLFMSAFTTSAQLADALEARGYNPEAKRSRYRLFTWGVKDTISSIVLVLFLTLMIVLAVYKFDIYDILNVPLPALS